MASGENVARRESILVPVLIVALGGALVGGSYGLALMESGVIFHTLPIFGGLVMGMAVSLALVRAGLRPRFSQILSLLVIWALGCGTILPIYYLLGRLTNMLAIQVAPFMPMIAGGLTGWATRRTVERVVGFRLEGVSLFVPWAAGFTMFVVGYIFFFAPLLFVSVYLMQDSAILFLLTGLGTGGLVAGCSAWLMFRDLEGAFRRHSSVKPKNTLDAGNHGALEVVSAPEETIKGKPKRRVDIPVPETPRQWRMVTLAGLLVFVLVAAFFLIVPVRTVTIIATPQALVGPSIVPYPTPPLPPQGTQMIFPPPTQALPNTDPQPLYYIGQKVQVANLTPDIANYSDWWVSGYQWLPEEGEWIYDVVTFNNITILRAEDQLSPTIPIRPT